MKKLLLSLVAPFFVVISADAGLITHTDRAVFDSLTNTTLETFELGTPPGGVAGLASPANSGNTPGLLPGYTFAASFGTLESRGAGFVPGLTSNAIVANQLPAFNIITFDVGHAAVGVDVFLQGPPLPIDVRFFNGATLLQTQTRNPNFGAPTFFGGITNGGDLITRIEIHQFAGLPEIVDNLAFGSLATPSVPEPSSIALLGIAAVGGLAYRRRRTK